MATVLIIDDSHLGRTHASIALSRTDHRVFIARDGIEALGILAKAKPDCVVLNRCTPAFSTEDLLDRIAKNPTPPSVIVRGTALTDESVRAFKARGAHSVLSNPAADCSDLILAIESCVAQRPYSKAG